MNVEDRLNKCKTHLLLRQPFFGIFCSMTRFIEDNSLFTAMGVQPTMATDGKNIFYSPEFIKSISDKELVAVMLHEVMHCIYMHCDKTRVGSRERQVWGIAADFAINYEITQMKEYELPKGGLYDEQFKEDTVEQIYDKIIEHMQKCPACGQAMGEDGDGQGKSQSSGGGGKHKHGKGGCEGKCPGCGKGFDQHIITKMDEEEIRDKLVSSYEAAMAQGQGYIPSGIKRLIQKLRQAKVPWQRVFHQFVGGAINKDDYSFERPNRRYLAHDLYLPDLRKYVIGNVVVAIDTSGSISEEEDLPQFGGELAKINGLIDEVTVMTCDAEVHEVIKLYKLQGFLDKLKMKGGGGTDFRPVFNKIKEKGLHPELLIYLTDTQGTFPEHAPPYPVLWVSTIEEGKVPWGQLVCMK